MNIKNIVIKIVASLPFGLTKRIKNIPGLQQLQLYIIKKWVNKEEFVATISGGPAKGLQFPVKMPQDKLMWIGTWELEFAKALYEKVKPGWTCYDIGGYKGYYAGVMALKGAKEVFVFEPMPANAEKVKKLIQLNPELPIRLKQVAVTNKTGTDTFKMMEEETMGKLKGGSFQKEDVEISNLTVDCITLDDLVNTGTPEPDFIKIDVEGAEELVLKGSFEMLKRKRPFLMIEVHSPEIGKRCIAVLKDLYSTITVFETGKKPGDGEPEICHFIAHN